jgi:hypothetical protein
MRILSLAVLAAAVLTAACSHDSKKADAPPETKAPVMEKAKADAAKAEATDGTKVECAVKGDSRILEVRAKGNGCELGYTKAGKEGIVASAAHGTDYCQKAFEKLRDKLKGSGYDCK